jgi:hypothetical protein
MYFCDELAFCLSFRKWRRKIIDPIAIKERPTQRPTSLTIANSKSDVELREDTSNGPMKYPITRRTPTVTSRAAIVFIFFAERYR